MLGPILNAFGIIIGGLFGWRKSQGLNPQTQSMLRVFLGAATVYVGLKLTWNSLNGGFLSVLKQLGIVLVGMILGKQLGRILHLQHFSNKLGHYAKKCIETQQSKKGANNGVFICSILFCVAPLGVLGGLQDGLNNYFWTLALKAVLDGLAMMAFVQIFGSLSILAFLPVFVFEGFLSLLGRHLQPFLLEHDLLDSINATGGLLVFCVSLVILELKKIEITDYLPSLLTTPLLASLFK